jgi:phage shock protein C
MGGARVTMPAMTTAAHTSDTPSAPPRARSLLRSRNDRFLGGVCGGLGEYFAVDPALFRIGAVVLAVVGGFSLVAYPILWIFVPRDDGTGNPEPLAIWRMLGGRDGQPPRFGRTALIVAVVLVAVAAAIAVGRPRSAHRLRPRPVVSRGGLHRPREQQREDRVRARVGDDEPTVLGLSERARQRQADAMPVG